MSTVLFTPSSVLHTYKLKDGIPFLADVLYIEGGETEIKLTRYERDDNARRKCLEHYGYTCKICGFNFEQTYGEMGKGYIHVHHIIPMSEIGHEYTIDPINDLIPVCPNCHAMLHRAIGGEVQESMAFHYYPMSRSLSTKYTCHVESRILDNVCS